MIPLKKYTHQATFANMEILCAFLSATLMEFKKHTRIEALICYDLLLPLNEQIESKLLKLDTDQKKKPVKIKMKAHTALALAMMISTIGFTTQTDRVQYVLFHFMNDVFNFYEIR
jgi:hypothetical protein